MGTDAAGERTTSFSDQSLVSEHSSATQNLSQERLQMMFSGAWVSPCARVSLPLSACTFEPVHVNMSLSPNINEIGNLVIHGSQRAKPIRKLSEVENQLW